MSKWKEYTISFMFELLEALPGIIVMVFVVLFIIAGSQAIDELNEKCRENPERCEMPHEKDREDQPEPKEKEKPDTDEGIKDPVIPDSDDRVLV